MNHFKYFPVLLILAALTITPCLCAQQAVTIVQQTITGSGTNFITAAQNIPSGFTRASYSWSISQPQNNSTFGQAVVQGSDDGQTWRDMFGLGSSQGTTGSGSGSIGTLPKMVRAILNWNGGFVLSVSVTLLP